MFRLRKKQIWNFFQLILGRFLANATFEVNFFEVYWAFPVENLIDFWLVCLNSTTKHKELGLMELNQ